LKLKIYIFLIFYCATNAFSQFKQDTSQNLNYLVLPAVFRTPETGWGYGGSASITFKTSHRKDSLTRTSSINTAIIFTERGQNFQFIDGNIFFPQEKFIFYFDGGHSFFPEYFWGIGSKTKNKWEELYESEQIGATLHLKKQLFEKFFLGVLYDYQNVYNIKYINEGVFDSTVVLGRKTYQNSGGGLSLSYDSRNKAFWPTKGFFANLMVTRYNEGIGSDFDFTKLTLDLRLFQKLFLEHILAVQFYNYSTFGGTPMKSMARFGGVDNMRGFYQGRFRDNNMSSLIAEYRAPIYWRISLVAFGGIGNVYSNNKNILKNELLYSFGGGIRLRMLKKDNLNIRIDYGYYNKYNSGLYFTLGECF
jgi:outer membrane protein assembly factor BamA